MEDDRFRLDYVPKSKEEKEKAKAAFLEFLKSREALRKPVDELDDYEKCPSCNAPIAIGADECLFCGCSIYRSEAGDIMGSNYDEYFD